MLTFGLAILMSGVAQPALEPESREEFYRGLVEQQQIRISLPAEISGEPNLEAMLRDKYQGFLDRDGHVVERFGQLKSVQPVRRSGEFLLEIVWDEPLSRDDGTVTHLNDTLHLAGRTYKLDVAAEDPSERSRRHKAVWEAADYILIGDNPFDRNAWIAQTQVKRAEASLQLVRENEQREAALASAPVVVSTTVDAPAQETRGFFSGRGTELVVVLTGLVLAAVVAKALVI